MAQAEYPENPFEWLADSEDFDVSEPHLPRLNKNAAGIDVRSSPALRGPASERPRQD